MKSKLAVLHIGDVGYMLVLRKISIHVHVVQTGT